jgi:hypothetical protein
MGPESSAADLLLQVGQLRTELFPRGLPAEREAPLTVDSADVGETEEVEGLGLLLASTCPSLGCIAAKLDQARLVGVELELEGVESCA